MEYKYTDKCRDITGRGGSYEESCRGMVIRGMEWLEGQIAEQLDEVNTHPSFDASFLMVEIDQSELIGVMIDSCMMATRGMLNLSLNHFYYASRVGWAAYIDELEKEHKDNQS